MNLKHWLIGDAVALDEMGNVIILDGDAHVTISAHCGAQYAHGKPCWFCILVCQSIQKGLGWIWPNLRTHCANAWRDEKALYRDSKNLPGGN